MPGRVEAVHQPNNRYIRAVAQHDTSIYITRTYIEIPCRSRGVAERLTALNNGTVVERPGIGVVAHFPLAAA